MDDIRFDTLARGLSSASTRRKVAGGLLAGTLAIFGGAAAIEAKRGGNGKGKAKGRGKAKGKAFGQSKIAFCHQPDEEGAGQVLEVASPARKGHEKHGDVECPPDPCKDYTNGGDCTVTDGVADCGFTPVVSDDDIACEVDDVAGTCDQLTGECVVEEPPVE